MREIKFRVWDNRFKKYIKSTDVRINAGNGERHGRMSSGNVPEWEIEQYTGLEDKNGKEIYEGDILHDGKGENGRVDYIENISAFMMFADNQYWYLNEGDESRPKQLQYTEIIGNIHEVKQ